MIFLICPVRQITDAEKAEIANYVERLEDSGHQVHWPTRDTNQEDPVGLQICSDNLRAIKEAEEVHIWWCKTSQGSLFDLGMAFALEKKIVLANPESIPPVVGKSFNNVLLAISKRTKPDATEP